MSKLDKEDLHSWIEKFSETVLDDLSPTTETNSRSCIFLDSQTINLMMVYMIMNKEVQVSQKEMRQTRQFVEIEKEIDALMAENKEQFEELIKEAKKRL